MKILFIGDNLIRGTRGVSFVRPLARRYPGWQFVNAGINGEPLLSIGRRLRRELAAGSVYNVIVIGAGTNDLLLPTFLERGAWFRGAARHQLRQGHQPLATAERFERSYRQLVQHLRSHCRAQLVLLTLGCVGEKLDTNLNRLRQQYNHAIRRVAAAYECAVADAGTRVEEHLRQPGPDYLMRSFFNTAIGDALHCLVGRADALSRRRGLRLTIDGGHLNSRGAALFGRAVEEQLLALAQPRLA
jgi:lysophospholipase L1-like esterase